jgi:flagellar biogenesis protein FliO
MKSIQKIILSLCIIFIIVLSISWLALRFTAPNPTHRWYSSQIPDELAQQSRVENWRAAEIILAGDLGLPDNNLRDNRQCFCSPQHSAPPNQCNSCTQIIGLSNYRIPDVVSTTIIADSKYYQSSVLRVDEQLSDFALIAEITNRDLWIFVPIFEEGQTPYTSQALDLVRSTGGDIVAYYVVDGYEIRHIVEQAIPNIIIILLAVGAGVLIVGYIVNNLPKRPSHENDELDDAEQSVEDTEEFMKRMERLSKRSKDEDDKKGKS